MGWPEPSGCRAVRRPRLHSATIGTGESREARLEGVAEALADPLVHLHVYAKRRVFERRKMGHLAVVWAADVEDGLARGRAAAAKLRWA